MHTTICLRPEYLRRLELIAEKRHCSKNIIIRSIIIGEISRLRGSVSSGVAVQYQPDSEEELCLVHVFLDPDLYEACLDLRKFTKKSLSYIISLAIMREYDKDIKICDNYQFFYQVISRHYRDQTTYILKHHLNRTKKEINTQRRT